MNNILQWSERPPELAALINPSFGALILNAASLGYIKETEAGLPFIASFFVLPIILHKDTRISLPRTIRTKMHSWIATHGEVKTGFVERAHTMVPYTREALAFGIERKILALNGAGAVYGHTLSTKKTDWTKDDEPSNCIMKSEFLGRWLGITGDLSAIFAMWGIRP